MYDPSSFYKSNGATHFLPGDILYLKNYSAIEDSYWMVITSLCDCEHREHIILSKIKSMATLQRNEGFKGNLKSYRIYYLFYLPPFEDDFPESFAHYGKLISISRKMLEQSAEAESDCKYITSLSADPRILLQFHLANHFTRSEDVELFIDHIHGLVKQLVRI